MRRASQPVVEVRAWLEMSAQTRTVRLVAPAVTKGLSVETRAYSFEILRTVLKLGLKLDEEEEQRDPSTIPARESRAAPAREWRKTGRKAPVKWRPNMPECQSEVFALEEVYKAEHPAEVLKDRWVGEPCCEASRILSFT